MWWKGDFRNDLPCGRDTTYQFTTCHYFSYQDGKFKIGKDLKGGALMRRPHLVNWLTIYMDKRSRGSSVRSLFILNKILLDKCVRDL